MDVSPSLAVLVYGAAGYTGQLVVSELARRRVPFAIAGRGSASMIALGRRHAVPAFEAESVDSERLAAALGRARVVLNCAGPFAVTGCPIFEAALRTRTHLVDLSGEPDHLRQSLARDAEARAAGIAVVHSVGFDVVPAEALAWLCQRTLGQAGRIDLATAHDGGTPSGGTLRSCLDWHRRGCGRGLSWIDGQLVDEPIGAERRTIDFPEPLGRRAMASTASAEVVLLSHSLGVHTLRHYVEADPHIGSSSSGGGLLASADDWTRALAQLERQGRRGPTEAARRRNRFGLWCRAQDVEGRARAMTLDGADPYGLSASLAATCAAWVAEATFAPRGVLTPAQAFDPQRLLAALAHRGVRWGQSAN